MTAARASTRRTLRQIFVAPLVLAIVTSVGLCTALVGDGLWDALSWIALGVPLATIAWMSLRPRRARLPPHLATGSIQAVARFNKPSQVRQRMIGHDV